MFLSDRDILSKVYGGEINITPFVYNHVNASSIDLTLSKNYKVPRKGVLIQYPYDKDLVDSFFDIGREEHSITLSPNDFILAQINETIELPNNLLGQIHNRNSIIRLGINVGLSSYINPGYKGQLPIVIHNLGQFNVELVFGMRICQLAFAETGNVQHSYAQRQDAKYHGEIEPTTSKLSEDIELSAYANDYNKEELSLFLERRIKEKSYEFFNSLTDAQKRDLGLL